MPRANRLSALVASLFALVLLAAPAAKAAPITFSLTYAGTGPGNSSSASGSITFDDAVLPLPGNLFNATAAQVGITAFSITVSGATSGNGTFGLGDVTNWVWRVGAGVDLTTELVGQAGFDDFNWCASFFAPCTAPAPGGVANFTIRTDAETGQPLRLTSMIRTSVPESTTAALFGIGLVCLAIGRRRRRVAGRI